MKFIVLFFVILSCIQCAESKKEQGPGELVMTSSVKYDNQKEEIYMNDLLSGKIKVYSFDGDFIRDISVGKGEYLIYYNADNKLFICIPCFFVMSKNRMN